MAGEARRRSPRSARPKATICTFKPSQVALLDALLAERARGRLRRSLRPRPRAPAAASTGIAPPRRRRSFRGELRGYQRDGLGWLRFLRDFGFGGCLADDMGLGKTVQVLALLRGAARGSERGRTVPSLVVVPRSLIFNWMSEAARFTPELRVLDSRTPDRARRADAIRRGRTWCSPPTARCGGTSRRCGSIEFDYVVLDEAQAIKNAGSATAKAARLLRGRIGWR